MDFATIPTPPIAPANRTVSNTSSVLPVLVEAATELDAAAIAKVARDTFTATFGHSIPKNDLENLMETMYSTEAVLAEFKDSSKTYLVARIPNGNVLGIAQVHRGQTHPSIQVAAHEVAIMQKVYVDTAMHGQGIGYKLVAAIEQLARNERYKQLWLRAWEGNSKAHRLYQRLGYTKTGEIKFATTTGVWTDQVWTKTIHPTSSVGNEHLVDSEKHILLVAP